MYEFKLPDPGEGLLEAEIVSWRVAVGDTVAVNDILLEIETAKSLVELPSPYAGTVAELLVAEGDTVAVGTLIIRIAGAGEAPGAVVTGEVQDSNGEPALGSDAPPEPPAEPSATAMLVGYGAKAGSVTRRPRKARAAATVPETGQVHDSYDTDKPVSRRVDEVTPSAKLNSKPSGDTLPPPGQPTGGGQIPRPPLAKPPVRRVARDLGVDLGAVRGTGPGGLITHEDVIAAAGEQGRVTPPSAVEKRLPLRGVRREMFRSMTASLNVPQATAWVEVDVTRSVELIEALKARREFQGLRVSPLLVFAKAACLAIARNPEINSSFDEATEEIILHRDVNLGIAAATPRGLVVPNIKKANQLNLLELATALNEMVAIAKQGKVQPGHLALGTFTITNVGVFGIDAGTPIMNPGEAAIMCLGTIVRRPWVVGEGADERIEPRSVCTVALTFDHRLVDGEMGSKFLADVATIMGDPGLAMLF
ncbi:MAG: 2-oxo acid dehydrogenase subunit E2 [Propionibacteriaceae bacterium]|nr:2-oxo acid dehydrogenase subunit E2 [Propionibacteriaceae bacterium]